MEPLVQRIVDAGLITREQAEIAQLDAVKISRSLWSVLVKLRYISEESIMRFFAQEAQIPYVHLPDYRIKKSALDMLEEDFCRQNTVIPLCCFQDTLFVACNNPFNATLLDMIGKLSHCAVEPLMATATSITQAIDYYWREDSITFDVANYLVKPQPVKGMMFWRESERIAVDWPMNVFVQDEVFSLAASSCLEGRAHDISRDGSAIGIYLPLYVPRGVRVMVVAVQTGGQSSQEPSLTASGEIVQCFMQHTGKFSIGIRFSNIAAGVRKQFLLRARGKQDSKNE